MDDADKFTVLHRTRLVVTQGQHGTSDHFTVEVIVVRPCRVKRGQELPGQDRTVAVLDRVTGVQHFTGDGVQRFTGLMTEHLRAFLNNRVNRGHFQDVGVGEIPTVLSHGTRDLGHGEFLAVRSDTLGKRRQLLRKRSHLSEIDGLGIAFRKRPLLAKLIMNQFRKSVLEQNLVIIGFHLNGHTGVTGDVGVQRTVVTVQVRHEYRNRVKLESNIGFHA